MSQHHIQCSQLDVRPEVIRDFLALELAAGRVLGPLGPDVVKQVQVNRFGLVPKGHQSGKLCMIVDLSFQEVSA